MSQWVAAVMPAKNAENFIDKTLAVFFDQSTRPDKAIVVNDGLIGRTSQVASAAGVKIVDMPD